MRRHRKTEGSHYGHLATVHRIMQAIEESPAHYVDREKPRTAAEARDMAAMRWARAEHEYTTAQRCEALAEARRRFDAAGGTSEAWDQIEDIEIASYHVARAVYGPNASTLAVDGFDRGADSWVVRTGELAGAACAAGPDTWREFLKLTRHPLSR